MRIATFAQYSASSSSGIAGPKPISIRVPTGNLTGFTLTTVVEPSRSGLSSMRRLPVVTTRKPSDASTLPATTRRPLPSAPRVGSRSRLGRDHRPGDGEQPRDLLRRAVDAGAVVLDEVAALGQLADADAGPGVERVVGQLLQHQTAQLARRDASLLLRAPRRCGTRSSRRARISNLERPVGLLNRLSDFENRRSPPPPPRGQFGSCPRILGRHCLLSNLKTQRRIPSPIKRWRLRRLARAAPLRRRHECPKMFELF